MGRHHPRARPLPARPDDPRPTGRRIAPCGQPPPPLSLPGMRVGVLPRLKRRHGGPSLSRSGGAAHSCSPRTGSASQESSRRRSSPVRYAVNPRAKNRRRVRQTPLARGEWRAARLAAAPRSGRLIRPPHPEVRHAWVLILRSEAAAEPRRRGPVLLGMRASLEGEEVLATAHWRQARSCSRSTE
jgi:hypothetical protein